MNEDVVDAAEEVEVEYRKRILPLKTYICPIRPRYRDNRYMYLTTLGRDLAGVSMSNAGRGIFKPLNLPPNVSILGTSIRKVFQEQKN